MPNRSKAVAVLFASLVFVPVLAGGRAACCITTPAAPASAHACCHAAAGGAHVMAPKPCCKTPVAPKPEAKARDAAPIAFMLETLDAGAPVAAPIVLPEAAAVRLARRAHHAQAPDDSPPDLLDRTSILLI